MAQIAPELNRATTPIISLSPRPPRFDLPEYSFTWGAPIFEPTLANPFGACMIYESRPYTQPTKCDSTLLFSVGFLANFRGNKMRMMLCGIFAPRRRRLWIFHSERCESTAT